MKEIEISTEHGFIKRNLFKLYFYLLIYHGVPLALYTILQIHETLQFILLSSFIFPENSVDINESLWYKISDKIAVLFYFITCVKREYQ